MAPKVFNVFGLAYGDEGKGTIVNALVKKHKAKAVVRYNGGPQAAHHVVEKNRFHCFSQFGSGTLNPGVKTHLSGNMIVKPESLLVEAERLKKIGVLDALERITISPECFLTTSMHAMIGQMLEASRGKNRYGSVGMGVGQAVLDKKLYPEKALTIQDLLDESTFREKLQEHCQEKIELAEKILENCSNDKIVKIYKWFLQNRSSETLYEEYQDFVKILKQSFLADDIVLERFSKKNSIVLEGAQGILLDPIVGFNPYVTKTQIVPKAAKETIEYLGASDSIFNIGVTRSFTTRHGAGPFITQENLPHLAVGEHNQHNRWQGSFRYGWLDLVALRYSIESSRTINALAVTCLDRFNGQKMVKVCNSYEYVGKAREELSQYFHWDKTSNGNVRIFGVKPKEDITPEQSQERTQMLFECRPLSFIDFPDWTCIGLQQKKNLPKNARNFLDFLASNEGLGVPLAITSVGPTADDKMYFINI